MRAVFKNLKKWKHRAEEATRLTHYLGHSVFTNTILGRFTPPRKAREMGPSIWVALKHWWDCEEKDRQNIENGLYLAPEEIVPRPKEFLWKSIKSFVDLGDVKNRIEDRDVSFMDAFTEKVGFPKYYTQSFHFQTDGYLSFHSSELYDHQVETVFMGSADTMRRLALAPIVRHLQTKKAGSAAKILDVACGTGKFTRELCRNFPSAKVTAMDLSPWYLKKARKLSPQATFLQGNAETIPGKANRFDVVTCVFLYHELPPLARENVSRQVLRTLKPGGIYVHVDSLQKGDVGELDGSLELFPDLFHEPFYKGYVESPLESQLQELGFEIVETELAFYSKITVAQKCL